MKPKTIVMLAMALSLLAAPLPAQAQQTRKSWRIGFIDPAFGPAGRILPALRARLTELGYVEGQNLTLDVRSAEGDPTRLPLLATDLVQLAPTVIVTVGSAATNRATATIPIVMATSLDPVREGVAQSLQRRGGNVTGLTHGWSGRRRDLRHGPQSCFRSRAEAARAAREAGLPAVWRIRQKGEDILSGPFLVSGDRS